VRVRIRRQQADDACARAADLARQVRRLRRRGHDGERAVARRVAGPAAGDEQGATHGDGREGAEEAAEHGRPLY
jgi:hypothetical protein